MNQSSGTDPGPLLSVSGLTKHYPIGVGRRRGKVHAVDGVSFALGRGETLSLVGESGCGKSTVGRLVVRLVDPTEGEIRLKGRRIDNLSVRELRSVRKELQMIFQDPYSSLNPKMRIRDILSEPMDNFRLHTGRLARASRLAELMEAVRLPRAALDRYPHEFSGGQRQRISIARALGTGADIIVCDEAVSALDVSVKAQVVNLLVALQKQLGVSLLFISHDLAIVEHLSHRVAVMYLGKIVETADRRSLFLDPKHPYTRALLAAVPRPDPTWRNDSKPLAGEVPSAIDPPRGCRFNTRCPLVQPRCHEDEPPLRDVEAGRQVACHFA